MRRRKNTRNRGSEVKLEMTPMIDVVFQLLIFFIVAIKHEDILSRLDVLRPAPSKDGPTREPISIVVGPAGYTFRGTPMGEAELGRSLARIAHYDRSTTITLRCLPESDHGLLVKALDLCARSELNQLAVFSQ